MPCYDPPREEERTADHRRHYRQLLEARAKVDHLTQLLCKQCRTAPNNLHPEVRRWWRGHSDWHENSGEAYDPITVEIGKRNEP